MKRRNLKTTDRILMAGAGVVGISLLAGTAYALSGSTPPAVPTTTVAAEPASGSLKLTFVGDTMLGDEAQPRLDAEGYDWPLAKVKDLLAGDVVIANAEAPITAADPLPLKKFNYAAQPEAAAALKKAGVDVLGLSNNHSMDAGPAGLADTEQHAQTAGLATFGAGANRDEALKPLLVDAGDKGKVAVLGFGENFGASSTASSTEPGMVAFSTERIVHGYELAKAAGADSVVAYVHWGDNYAPVNEEQRYWAKELVAAGYDLVVGSGSHVLQPVEVIDGVPVVYSLGNFAFTTPGRFGTFGVGSYGAVANIDLAARQLELTCLQVDNTKEDFQARICDAAEASTAFAGVNPDLVLGNASATLAW